MKINPKCKAGKDYSYSAKGFLLPCCWCDTVNPETDKELHKLFNPELHLSNVDSIEEVLLSDEWLNFDESITKDFDKAPKVCKRYCGTKQQFKGIVR
jgi:hypothetical protein|tara:strand:+ start:353 stop:643 length:291 start_codon:yes stop_codon:yes gene_type:complete